VLGFNESTGNINYLFDKSTSQKWVQGGNGLLQFQYQTYGQDDYTEFLKEYLFVQPPPNWAWQDLGKPNMQGKQATWKPKLQQLYRRSVTNPDLFLFLIHLTTDPDTYTNYGAPEHIWIEVAVPANSAYFSVDLQVFNKTATRIAEALWVSFYPQAGAAQGEWFVNKLDSWISAEDIVKNGSKHLHSVNDGVLFNAGNRHLAISSIDAPVVSIGTLNMFPTPVTADPNINGGAHFNLYNNLWGTNYIMWYPYLAEDASQRFRFLLSSS